MKKVILGIFLIGILLLIGCTSYSKCEECPTLEENTFGQKALMDIQMYQSGINKLDSNEFLWEFWLINYGNEEAKNVIVNCDVRDDQGYELISKSEIIGNIASRSAELESIYVFMPDKFKNTPENTLVVPICFVSECDNCDILYKRIPDMVESFKVK